MKSILTKIHVLSYLCALPVLPALANDVGLHNSSAQPTRAFVVQTGKSIESDPIDSLVLPALANDAGLHNSSAQPTRAFVVQTGKSIESDPIDSFLFGDSDNDVIYGDGNKNEWRMAA